MLANNLENLLQLHMSEIKEGHTFKKTDLLDSEDDADYIDEYIDENPIDRQYTKAANKTPESKQATPYEKIDKIINNIEDQQMRSLLQKWMYSFKEKMQLYQYLLN